MTTVDLLCATFVFAADFRDPQQTDLSSSALRYRSIFKVPFTSAPFFMASLSPGLLASSRNDLSRKSVWICGSCFALAPGVQSTTTRSINPRAHQRRLSSSKTSRSSKTDARAISAPTNEVAARSTETSKVSRSEDNPHELRSNGQGKCQAHLPSVPSTQYLHPTGKLVLLLVAFLIMLTISQRSM